AGLVPVPAALVARGLLGMAVAAGLARRRFLPGRGSGGSGGLGFLALALGFLFLPLALGLLGPAPVLLGQTPLLLKVALARLLELAQDLGLFLVHRAGGRGLPGIGLELGLDQGDLLAHHHVDGRLVPPAAHGQFLLARAAEGDL